MKNKIFIVGLGTIFLILLLFSTTYVFAHPGRTDSDGGHYDYDNDSGLGEYHYHHGYPAHLHKNGVCPYIIQGGTTKDYTDTSKGGSAVIAKDKNTDTDTKKIATKSENTFVSDIVIPLLSVCAVLFGPSLIIYTARNIKNAIQKLHSPRK